MAAFVAASAAWSPVGPSSLTVHFPFGPCEASTMMSKSRRMVTASRLVRGA